MFNSDTYRERRRTLKKMLKKGIVLIPGNSESSMNYRDNTYRFRQDSSFLYYFGLNQPDLTGIIDIENDLEIIYGNDLTIDEIVWMGTQPDLKERSAASGISQTGNVNDLHTFLKNAESVKREIMFLPQYRNYNMIKISEWLNIPLNSVNEHVSVRLINAVSEMRNSKSDEEIEEIEKAVNITVKMHEAAMRAARPGMKEYEITALIHKTALENNCSLSFPIIATVNGQTLHNHYHGNTMKEGDMLLVDAGAETELSYAGDMSSTIPVSREFTKRQREIYDITLDAHNSAINMLKPGIEFRDVHLHACIKIAEGLKSLGLMTGNTEDAVSAGAHALFFPCGLGHMMGLDVHDMENLGEKYVGYAGREKSTQFGLKSLRLSRTLQERYVITIEPGIYFIPELIDIWSSENKFPEFINYPEVEKYRDFGGIRNEEDILITSESYRILGNPLPKRAEDVEKMKTS